MKEEDFISNSFELWQFFRTKSHLVVFISKLEQPFHFFISINIVLHFRESKCCCTYRRHSIHFDTNFDRCQFPSWWKFTSMQLWVALIYNIFPIFISKICCYLFSSHAYLQTSPKTNPERNKTKASKHENKLRNNEHKILLWQLIEINGLRCLSFEFTLSILVRNSNYKWNHYKIESSHHS